MAAQQGARRPAWIAAIAVGFLIILGGIGYFVWHSGSSDVESGAGSQAQPVAMGEVGGLPNAKPADVPTALLCEYYEHGMEHTPPRDPTGAMQRRERFYRAPTDPFVLLESKLTKDAPDADLLAKAQAWQKAWMSGRDTTLRGVQPLPDGVRMGVRRTDAAELAEIEKAAGQSSLPAESLMDIGRAFEFLDDDNSAATWFHAAMTKAQTEFAKTQPGDPKALPFLHQLDQTRALWRTNDYRTLEKRFTFAETLNPPLSVESRRAGCLLATSLFYQGRSNDAANVILRVWDEQKKAGDLGVLEQSDFGEMNWVAGLYLYVAKRYEEAIPYYKAFLNTNDNRRQAGAMYYANTLTALGRTDEAEEIRKKYNVPKPMTQPALPPGYAQVSLDGRLYYATTRPMTRPGYTQVILNGQLYQATTQPTTRSGTTQMFLNGQLYYATTQPMIRPTTRLTTRPSLATTRPTTRPRVTAVTSRPAPQIYVPRNADQTVIMLYSRDDAQINKAVDSIRTALKDNPAQTVDKLNDSWMTALMQARQFAAIDELATAGTLAVAADTWRIEQLQKQRINALRVLGKDADAEHAAKALFNLCGMGFTKDSLILLSYTIEMAHGTDRTVVRQFKIQMLASAQEDPAERKKLLDKAGGNSVLQSIPADPAPYAEAIEKRKGMTDYRGLYGTGNLLLLSGRIKEARDAFMKVYQIAPPEELKYASEGIAKLIKAEEGGLGKANQFVASIRPRE